MDVVSAHLGTDETRVSCIHEDIGMTSLRDMPIKVSCI